jgi:hypothetical protein
MASISENTQTDFDNAEAIVIDMLRTVRPDVPLRRGTVLRELLVRPVAEIYAADTRRVEESMRSRSLKLMQESGIADTDEVNAILSNFSTSLYEGKNASGYLFVQVEADSVYSISSDTVFSTEDGLEYTVTDAYVVTSSEVSGDGYLELKQTDNGLWYFLVPVYAKEVGAKYEIEAGVRLSVEPEFSGFVSATSYAKFSGGLDAETVSDAVSELMSAVSLRGLGSRLSIKSTLLDKNAGNFAGQVLDCSVVGYGDAEQIRDKTNVFGVATGGKVDLFIRSFTSPSVVTKTKIGVWDNDNSEYVIHISHDEMPGYYAVKSVLDANSEPALSSFGSTGMLSADSYSVHETFEPVVSYIHVWPDTLQGPAYTCFRDVTLHVHGVGFEPEVPEVREFLVSAYAYPVVAAVQDYVDRKDVRSLRDDVLVRSAPICLVKLSASVSVPSNRVAPDLYEMRSAVASYINSRSFVPRLTASEIVAVLNKFDISRVEMMFGTKHGFKMQGRIKDASGKIVDLAGPDLDVDGHSDPANLVTPNTVCFATNVEDIEIKIIDDRR